MNAITPHGCETAFLPRVGEALSLMLRQCPPVAGAEWISPSLVLGRVLVDDVHAAVTMPPCDRSAMDGYAFRFGAAGPLRVAASAPAGAPYAGAAGATECIAISTGGAIPQGCDTVALREHCIITPAGIVVTAKGPGANIRRRGEDFHEGDRIAATGTRLHARNMALLAAAGVTRVAVRPVLRIAILSIGDELIGEAADSICDANRPMLTALCAARGHMVTDLGILPDDRAQLAATLAHAAGHHDLILLSGGTSAGDSDHVRDALLDCGGQIVISGVAMRPGKPVSFGHIGRTPVLALPGNPAAAYVAFLMLGLKLLRHMTSEAVGPDPWQIVRAGFSHAGKKGVREFLRARLATRTDGTKRAECARDNGPAMLASLAEADGLIVIPEDAAGFETGDEILFASFDALERA